MSTEYNLRRNILTSMAAFAVNLMLLFVGYRLVIKGGGLESLGLWSTLMAWIFLIRLGDVGMTTAAVRFISLCDAKHEGTRIRTYLDTSLAFNAVLFSVLAVLGYFAFLTFLPQILPGHNAAQETARSILPLIFLGFVLSNLSGLVLGGLTGLHRGYQSALITIGGALTQFCIVLLLVPRLGLAGLAWGQLSQHLFVLAVGWGLFLMAMLRDGGSHGGLLPIKASLATFREMLGFSLKAQFANIINGLFEPISKILISRVGGLELLGIYELAYKLVSLPRNALVTGVHATTPAMTRLMIEDSVEANTLYFQSLHRLLTRGSLVLFASVIVAPVASWLWLNQVNNTFCVYVAILALGFMANLIGVPAYLLGVASGKMKWNIIAGLAALFTMVLFSTFGNYFSSEFGQVAGVSFGLMIGGILILRLNVGYLKALQ